MTLLNKDRTLKTFFAVLLLALPLLLSLLVLKTGLHVSGLYSVWCPPVPAELNSESFICSQELAAPDSKWIVWMVAGVFTGAFISAFWRNSSFKLRIEKISSVKNKTRLLLAGAGGLLAGVSSAAAGGCTSSIGLTGAALLSVSAFVFLGMFFAGGLVASIFFRRFWDE